MSKFLDFGRKNLSDKFFLEDTVNSLSAQQNSIVQFAKEKGSITSRQMEELLGVKQRRSRSILGELVNMGILERQGAYKNTVYVLKNRI